MKKDNLGKETKGANNIVLEPPVEPEVLVGGETPTAEEQLAELQGRLQTLTKELESTKKGLSTAHNTLREKDLQLKRRIDVETQTQDLKDQMKILASYVASSIGKSEEDFEEASTIKKTDLLRQFEDLEQKRKKEREIEEFNRQAGEIWGEALALELTEEDDDYWKIWDSIKIGEFKRANIQINKLKKNKESSTPEPGKRKTVDELSDEDKAEIARQYLEKEGKLKTNISVPSGKGGSPIPTDMARFKEWVDGLSLKEYEGMQKEINEMVKSGKIK